MSAEHSRRDFLRTDLSGMAAGLAFPTIVPARALGLGGRVAPSNRVTLAVIGTGNQGFNDIKSFLSDERVQIVAVCDVNRESAGYWDGKVGGREPAKRLVEKHYAEHKPSGTYRGCDACVDFREILGRKDIDAVEVCTPDHWHAIPVLEACKAGKDIYCQKPLSLTIAEGRAMSYAVNKHHVVFQTGSQQRSDHHFRRACELVRNGRIGELKTVRVGLPGGRPDYAKCGDRKKPEPVPAGFEYNTWLGPAPEAPYAPARCHVNFRWIYDYSGGQVTDWGGHHPDCAQWGMGTELTGPIEIRNVKGDFPARSALEHGDRVLVRGRLRERRDDDHLEQEQDGRDLRGHQGDDLRRTAASTTANPKSILDSKIGPNEIHLYKSDDHFRNFIDCVISRGPTAAPVEVAHRSITICHLGNIAMRLGRKTPALGPQDRADHRRRRGLEDAQPALSRSVEAAACLSLLARP